ncbi:GDCCVxC domain-containing (seleno)protein [Paraburkholderia hospita]|nr:GDCCVxC domain-containing (seleno)protein [Paraburkholderia hospita]
MPLEACMWIYECRYCKTVIMPKVGDNCVFCSYGTIRCPPM